MITVPLVLRKIESNKRKCGKFYCSSKPEIVINESNIENVFKSIHTTITANIKKSLGKGSGWIIDSAIDYNISISRYNPLAVAVTLNYQKN